MTKKNQLLRRPRPPGLRLVDLTHVDDGTPNQMLLNDSSDESTRSHSRSTDRELLVPSLHISEAKTTTTNLPILTTPKTTQLAMKNYSERYDSLERTDLDASDRFFRPRTETVSIEEEDRHAFNYKLLSRTTYKRLLSMSPTKNDTSTVNFSSDKKSFNHRRLEPNPSINLVREYSQFKNKRNPLLKPFKPLGPDPLPVHHQLKHFQDKRKNYENLSYYDESKQIEFTLNDFILANSYFGEEEKKIIQSILSTKHYKGFCKALEEKIHLESSKNRDKVHVQTLIPDMEPFEHRIPLRQLILEMASYLKKELSAKMGKNF
jgi:hypothetical protein